jgi:hypothetical protein
MSHLRHISRITGEEDDVMLSLNSHLRGTLAVCIILAPRLAPAQPVASSFDELRQVMKKGQTVVVTDASGERTKGKVADVHPSSLVLLIPEARTFVEGAVTEIRATDSLSNGALIGAAVGTGLAMWDYLIDPSEPGNAAVFTVAIGLGTAVGAGIDALVGGRVLYGAPWQTRRLMFLPVFEKDRKGALVSVRF